MATSLSRIGMVQTQSANVVVLIIKFNYEGPQGQSALYCSSERAAEISLVQSRLD